MPSANNGRPIAFHPISVLFETPQHAELIEKIGVRPLISEVLEEMLRIAQAQGCAFPPNFKDKTIEAMLKPTETPSIMYQDFTGRRPMEIETYLGSPVKLAQAVGVHVPRIETLYAVMHSFNILNQNRPARSNSPENGAVGPGAPPPRMSSANYSRPPMNGAGRGRVPSMGPPMRRGPPSVNNYQPRGPNGFPRGPGPGQLSHRPSFENDALGEEFSHLVLYDDIPEGDVAPGYMNGSAADLNLREREYMLRQREMQLREQQEYGMRRGQRRPPPSHRGGYDDDDDDDDFFDPMAPGGPPVPQIDPDNFDMMSVTSRRTRKAPSASQLRKNPEMGGGMNGRGGRGGPRFNGMSRNRSSQQLMSDIPGPGDSIMSNSMMGYSSNRFGTVDRKQMQDESRANSLTRERLAELQGASLNGMNGAYPQPRRMSLSPADQYNNNRRVSGRPSPPGEGYMNGNGNGNGMPVNGRPSPPGMMRQPIPRHPPGQGNAVAPQQVEQHAGVSKPYPPNRPTKQVRSLTGSASASAGSGDSALIDSENSAHSSQSSFTPRPPIGVR